MSNAIYVNVGKPITFKVFEKFKAPMGWIRIDILQRKINDQLVYRNKFTSEELDKIQKVAGVGTSNA